MRHATPTSGVSDCMPSGKTAVKSSVGAKRQVAENMVFSLTEPNLARFAQKETKALQRPKSAALPVSEVRLVWPNPFEYTKNSATVGGPLRVCKRKLAEREGFEPSVPVRVQRFSRPSQSTTLAPLRAASAMAKSGPPLISDLSLARNQTMRPILPNARIFRSQCCDGHPMNWSYRLRCSIQYTIPNIQAQTVRRRAHRVPRVDGKPTTALGEPARPAVPDQTRIHPQPPDLNPDSNPASKPNWSSQ